MSDTPVNPQLSELVEVAKAAQRQRREAPEVTSAERLQVPQRQIIRAYEAQDAKENRKGAYKYGFTTPEKLRRRAEEGCEPVIERGDFKRFGGDILVRRPTDLWLQREKRRKILAARQAGTSVAKKAPGVIVEETGVEVVGKGDKKAIFESAKADKNADKK